MGLRRVIDLDADSVKFRGKGIAGTATAGQTTNIEWKMPEDRLISGLKVILKDHAFGDKIHFEVVDVDNILGYGAGTVLDRYGEDWFVESDKQSQEQIHIPYPAKIYANLYLRLIYVSTGGTNVSVKCNYFTHKLL